jgi:hypothetical protein
MIWPSLPSKSICLAAVLASLTWKQQAWSVSFTPFDNQAYGITECIVIYYETAYATLKQCSIQEQLEGPLMTITYGATLQTPQK